MHTLREGGVRAVLEYLPYRWHANGAWGPLVRRIYARGGPLLALPRRGKLPNGGVGPLVRLLYIRRRPFWHCRFCDNP